MLATRLKTFAVTIFGLGLLLGTLSWLTSSLSGKPKTKGPFDVAVPKVSTDPSIEYDYDIVYVRTPRKGNKPHSSRWPDASLPMNVDAGGDLMLLHPDGSEERLVAGGKGSVTDPFVSFDGEWVFYSQFEELQGRKSHGGGAAGSFKNPLKKREGGRPTPPGGAP